LQQQQAQGALEWGKPATPGLRVDPARSVPCPRCGAEAYLYRAPGEGPARPSWWQCAAGHIFDAGKPIEPVLAAEVADQTGCDCVPIETEGKRYHEWWCAWWDRHPEAQPF